MSYWIKLFATYFLLLLGINVFSQNDAGPPLRSERYVYINAGALMNIPAGFQLGYEQRISKNWYWDIEGGILLFSKVPTIMDFNAKNRKGFRLQTGSKIYMTDRFFIGPQFLFKKVTMEENEWFWRFENEYEQRFNTYRIRRTYAFAAELGWHYTNLDSPISIEVVYALGVQNFNVRYDSFLPPDVTFEQLENIGTEPGTFIYPFFNYRIKIKYALDWEDPIQARVEQKEKEARLRKSKRSNKKSSRSTP